MGRKKKVDVEQEGEIGAADIEEAAAADDADHEHKFAVPRGGSVAYCTECGRRK